MILGVHSGHDCGAALVSQGCILAAVNEERISRNKLSFGVPKASVEEVLNLAGADLRDIEAVALESIGKPNFLLNNARPWIEKVRLTNGRALDDFFYVKGRKLRYHKGVTAVAMNLAAMTGLPRLAMVDAASWLHLRRRFPDTPIVWVGHHDAHWASAYYTSGQSEALSVTIEEFDGRHAFCIDVVKNGLATPLARTRYPHSPGVFYSLVTRMYGFNQLLHAGKITGLAAYGDPARCADLVAGLMWDEGMEIKLSPKVYEMVCEYAATGRTPRAFAPYSREDVCAAFQRRLEETLTRAVGRAVEATGQENLILSGGVAANVKLNQRLHELPGVKRIFVHPGMSDCGVALGAALWLESRRTPVKPRRLRNVFFGTPIESGEAEAVLQRHGLTYRKPDNVHRRIAELLAQGAMVVRVTGRMEYGPRALGHRSILYHCGDPTVNGWLNARLDRSEFMPFAPAVPAEKAGKCFLNLDGAEYSAEFMTVTFDCTPWMRRNCPAVVHVDGTARPQLVPREGNPDFHAILTEYDLLTGIPALVNTSYNIHNEPMVRNAEDAVRVFMKTGLDYLALDGFIISAEENGLARPEDRARLLEGAA